MPNLVKKEDCTGCAACHNSCKLGAIEMKPDHTGFLYPEIIAEKCVECKACEKACPLLKKGVCTASEPKAYIAQNKSDEIRKQSTSGGAFTAIASEIIRQGGVVFGAAFVGDYTVRHICVDNEKDLARFRNSKYVQSEIGECFKQAKEFLLDGRMVCFSGTPCQINGLKSFLAKEYDNLITVDVMCRAVPSPKVFRRYLEAQRLKHPNMNRVVFRDKARGYSYSTLSIYDKNERGLYRGGSEYDQWLRLFFKGFCNRESCFDCKFQTGNRISDFTLWDCWGTQNYAPEMDDNKGTTNVIVWTSKGQALFHLIDTLMTKEIGIDNIDASLSRGNLSRPVFDKEAFWSDVEKLSPDEFLRKYVPFSFKIRIKSCIRQVIWRLHLHNTVRKSVHCIRKIKKRFRGVCKTH